MNFDQFGCERHSIELIKRYAQRNILISQYCPSKFAFFNLVDLYYRVLNQNAILIFLFIWAVFPLLFSLITAAAEKYLAPGLHNISARLNLTPPIAAMTIIAFANGTPDILTTLTNSTRSPLLAIGSLFGAFIFASTLVVSKVIYNSPDKTVHVPKMVVLKELGFYLLSIIVIVVFGFYRSIGYVFVIVYVLLYLAYVYCSLYIEQESGNKEVQKELQELQEKCTIDEEMIVRFGLDKPLDYPDIHKYRLSQKPDRKKRKKSDKSAKKVQDKDAARQGKKKLIGRIIAELFSSEKTLLENLFIGPLFLAGMFTNSYLTNPLMIFPFKFLILGNTLAFMLYTLSPVSLSLFTLFLTGTAFAIFCAFLEMFRPIRGTLNFFYEILSIFGSMGWISLLSGVIIDFIFFLAFYFSINEVILLSLLLAAGNSLGDYFGNAALAHQGEHVMAFISSYSAQNFNNFLGLAFSTLAACVNKNYEFDIFGFSVNDGVPEEEEIMLPVSTYFLYFMIFYIVLIIVVSVWSFEVNKYVITKDFIRVMVGMYLSFFVIAILFGYFSM